MSLLEFGEILMFFTPAIFADGTPPVFRNLPFAKKIYVPINTQLLGAHKTWGGSFVFLITGTIVGSLLMPVSPYSISAPLAGFLLGLGSLIGDIIGSFTKRILNYKEGKYIWFDSIDWLFGAWIMSFIFSNLSVIAILTSSVLAIVVFLVDELCVKYTFFKRSL